ncbi:TonB-dependent receptor [Novosphingobium bradum]|uniref:TonB-dependent receptor n=1 Tax=Novosphingobium bradum TaxID=1737444 RepID=A0ABV7IRU7_9SPHN
MAAHAQAAGGSGQNAAAAESNANPTDIVVTARRGDERLQDVPVSIQVVTGDKLDRLAITNFNDIAKLAPGLSFGGGDGLDGGISLRGIRWSPTGGTPAIPFYLNEVAFSPGSIQASLYDIGQVEVLRGPQGTARGRPSISGAVTLTTRRPNLFEAGGYISGQFASRERRQVQGAVSFPIIPGKLAVRLAGFYETYDTPVRSIITNEHSHNKNINGRISVRYEPSDSVNFNVMYAHNHNEARTYLQVVGAGSPGFTTSSPFGATLVLPAAYNTGGRTIKGEDFLSVMGIPNTSKGNSDLISANLNIDVAGQRLSYIFGYDKSGGPSTASPDTANMLIGYDPTVVAPRNARSKDNVVMTHELRLSSIRGDRFWDYDVGLYYYGLNLDLQNQQIASFLPGAFGAPIVAAPSPYVTNPAIPNFYALPILLDIRARERSYSAYANVMLHLPHGFELTVGGRYMSDTRPFRTVGSTLQGTLTLPNALVGGAPGCAFIGGTASALYGASFCDTIRAQAVVIDQDYKEKFHPFIYNVSLSRKFSDDLLVYGTVGSSYRTGVPNIGTATNDISLAQTRPERATSFELGLKSSFADRKAWFNLAVFQINYKGQINTFRDVNFWDVGKAAVAKTSVGFNQNADVRVRGLEAEIGFDPTRNLSLAANVSYSKISSRVNLLPCNDPANPPTATNPIARCTVPAGIGFNVNPPFQASVNGSYDVPLGPFNGYLRFLANYQGANPNFKGIVNGVAAYDRVAPYMLVDVFGGLRSPDGAWDIGVYAKNVFNKLIVVNTNPANPMAGLDGTFGPSGLSTVFSTQPRELGVQVRYSFGSR